MGTDSDSDMLGCYSVGRLVLAFQPRCRPHRKRTLAANTNSTIRQVFVL